MGEKTEFDYLEQLQNAKTRLQETAEALLAVSLAMEQGSTEYSGAVHLLAETLFDLSRNI